MSDESCAFERLPDALLGLTPSQQIDVLARMKSFQRARQGARTASDMIARYARRSASSYAGEFFAKRPAEQGLRADASPSALRASQAAFEERVAAEMERMAYGNLTALLAKAPPGTGQWTSFRFPRAGWTLLRIEDTSMPSGACCEVCERAQMRHSYVVKHPAWPLSPPADEGAETYACRLCAAHLLGGKADLRPRASKPKDDVTWTGSGAARTRNGELRPDRKRQERRREASPVTLPEI